MPRSLLSELTADATSPRLLVALSMGLVAGVLLVTLEVSFAAMIYSGELSALASRGAGLTLLGAFLICLTGAFTSCFKATVSLPQDAPAAVLATIAVTVVAALELDASMDTRFMTVASVLALSALLSGVAFIAIGRFRLANLLRFMPYPVVGGFLAGTGWLLSAGSIPVMSDVPLTPATLSWLMAPEVALKWVPGVLYGIVLFALMQRWNHYLLLPASLAVAWAGYYATFALAGMSFEEAQAAGYLVSGVPEQGLWPAFRFADLAFIDWPVVLQQLPGILTVVLVTVVGMLLKVSGIELAAGREMDMNKEFAAVGAGNLMAGMGGSFPGYPAISLSVLSLKAGAYSRLTGIVAALVVGIVLFFGGGLLEYFPKGLLGGSILLLGLSFIHEWIVKTRSKLPRTDYLIVVSIFLVIGLFGFMEGVAFGLVLTVVFFVIRFSRVAVVKSQFTAATRHSLKHRSVPQRRILSMEGGRIRVYELGGYIFFGSAATLVDSLKKALASPPHPDFMLFDFSQVSGFDISAISNFQRFVLNAGVAHTELAITAAPERLVKAMQRSFHPGVMQKFTFFPDLDQGLEWCEDQLIDRATANQKGDRSARQALFDESVDDLMVHLERQEGFEALVDRLHPWLDYSEHSADTTILKQGEAAQGVYLLTWGTAKETDPTSDIRTRSLAPGDVIAPLAVLGDYLAVTDFRADSDCKTACLSAQSYRSVEQKDPALALALHRLLIRSAYRES